MTFLLLLFLAAAAPSARRGQDFSVRISGMPGHVGSLRAQMTSKCDSEQVLEQAGSVRDGDDYVVTFMAPSDATPCDFKLGTIDYWLDGSENDYPDQFSPPQSVEVKIY